MQNKLDYTIRKWFKGLKEKYHLSLINKDSFKEIYSLQVSKRKFFVFVSSFILLIFSITFLLIAFTPLKRLVPGFESVNMRNQFVNMQKRLIVMEEEVSGKLDYAQHLDSIFNDFDVTIDNIDSIVETNKNELNPTLKNTPNVENHSSDELFQYHFFKPISGVITQKFKPQENHFGIDIVCEKNEAVKATLPGKVILATWSLETGNTIVVQHKHNMISLYKHNSILLKRKGELVKAGEVIAIVGNSGELTTGPHLHFEIWHNSNPINPLDVISFD